MTAFLLSFLLLLTDACHSIMHSFHFGMCKGKEVIAGCFKKFQAVETLDSYA